MGIFGVLGIGETRGECDGVCSGVSWAEVAEVGEKGAMLALEQLGWNMWSGESDEVCNNQLNGVVLWLLLFLSDPL